MNAHTSMSPLDILIAITFFKDQAAAEKREERFTLRSLAPRIRMTTARSKEALEWLKAARFGDARTEKNCLRNNANVIAVSGVEADYDGEVVPFSEAVDRLKEQGLAALIYTSPSHTEDKPRWRVLCPFTRELPPEQREHMLCRLNGLFGGIFSGESFTLSQSYYFGSVNNNPSHQVELIDGTAIDTRDDLDAIARGKKATEPRNQAETEQPISSKPISFGGHSVPVNDRRFEGYIRRILANVSAARDGEKHDTLRSMAITLGGIAGEAGFADAAAVEWLTGALPDGVKDMAAAKKTAAWGLAEGRKKPLALEDRPRLMTAGSAPPEFDDPGYMASVAAIVERATKGTRRSDPAPDDEDWPEPLDILADLDGTGAPELLRDHLPHGIMGFVFDTAARMGVDPAAVALAALVSCASVVTDDWRIQPKRRDDTWTESPRIWGAIVGDPSILKSPVLSACTRPVDRLEIQARQECDGKMFAYRRDLAQWKKTKIGDEPRHPVLARFMVENLTVEALSEVLRNDSKARQNAPAGKVLVRSDELAELLANLDRYNAGGRGGGDRGAFLRLYNGGRHTIDRVNRGAFACPNWSACLLGGIQPGPIQKIAKDAADDGMLQRFFYCVPAHQTGGQDRRPDREALARYDALFPALSALRPGKGDTVRLHAGAHQYREELDRIVSVMKATPDTTARMKAALGKFPGMFARLCLLFHLIDVADANARNLIGPHLYVVPEATAGRALAYLRTIILPHLLRADKLMYLTPQTGHARWVAGFILSRGFDRVTRRDVTRAYGALRAPETERELTSVMTGLASMGWLREEESGNPARPPAAWTVNPKVRSVFARRAEWEKAARKKAQEEMTALIRETLHG